MTQPPIDPLATKHTEPGLVPEALEQSSLLRQLFFEKYFRFALAVVAMAVIAAAILLPRMIRSTPPGFLPVIRVRILDKLQAWSLANTARLEAERGQTEAAVLAWRSAIANDPGDPAMSRSLVSLLVEQPVPSRKYLRIGGGASLWLLRLTDTNRSDLDLVARFFAHYELDQYVAELLRPVETNLSPVQAREYLKSLFNLGYMEPFGVNWDRYQSVVTQDPELQLYRAAWQVGWGPAATLTEGTQRLEAARKNPATTVLANRLALSVHFSRADIRAFEESLAVLEDRHQDRVSDHLGHWRLLINTGQRERAAGLAQAYSNPPDSPAAALMMADLFVQLGLVSYASDFLSQQVVAFDFSPDVWQRQADLFIALKRWDDLRTLAINVRASERIPPDLNGFASFLEGVAELNMNHPELAQQAFASAIDFPPNNPLLTYRMATLLSQLDQHDAASSLLKRLESDFGGLSEYWLQVLGTAYQARKFDVVRAAAARGYELATNNPIFINNYAASLLIDRTNAPLAVQLTLRRLALEPENPGAKINHAHALLQTGRLEDARRQLATLNPEALDSYFRTDLYLALFELNLRQGNKEAALKAYDGVEQRFLVQPQIDWMEAQRRSLTGEGSDKDKGKAETPKDTAPAP